MNEECESERIAWCRCPMQKRWDRGCTRKEKGNTHSLSLVHHLLVLSIPLPLSIRRRYLLHLITVVSVSALTFLLARCKGSHFEFLFSNDSAKVLGLCEIVCESLYLKRTICAKRNPVAMCWWVCFWKAVEGCGGCDIVLRVVSRTRLRVGNKSNAQSNSKFRKMKFFLRDYPAY
jgi:hypothetical protein